MKSKSTTGLSKFLIISFTIYIMYELYVYNKQLETQREEQERQRKEEQKQKEEEKKKNLRKKKIIILLLAITYFFVLFFPIIISKLRNPTTHIYSRMSITGNEKVYYLKNFKVTEITTKELLLKEREESIIKKIRNFIYILIRKDNKIFTGYVARRFFKNPNNNNFIKIPLITPNYYNKEKREFLLLNREEFEKRIKTHNVFRVKSVKTEKYKIYDIEDSYYYDPTGYHYDPSGYHGTA